MTTPRASARLPGRLALLTAIALSAAPPGIAARLASPLAEQPGSVQSSDLATAQRLFDEGQAEEKAGRYDAALERAERARAIREQILGPDDLAVADALHLVAVILDHKNEYKAAEPINRRALAIRERTLGPDHPDVAKSLFNLAWLASTRQDFAGAEALYARTLRIQEQALGPDHRDVVTTLNDFAVLYNRTGRYDEAIATNKRVIAIREAAGNESGVALALSNLGRVYFNTGDYPAAIDVLRRSLSIWERVQGPDHPRVANAVDGLAYALALSGDYAGAEPLFLRALAIREKTLGPTHPEVGTSVNNLGTLYLDKGDFERAQPLLLRDLAITEARLGPDHSFVAPPLSNLATIDERLGRYEQAEARHRRALAIRERAFGSDHLAVGVSLSRLGRLYAGQPSMDAAEGERLARRALAILEKAVGVNHPEVATVFATLATLAERKGDVSESEGLVRRALDIQEQLLGPTHPTVARTLQQLAALRQRQSDAPAALDLLRRAFDLRERHLARDLPLGSERQRAGYLETFGRDADQAIGLHIGHAPDSPDALDLALTTILRRKGRALDATTDSVATLRQHAPVEQRALFDRLASARAQFSAVTLSGPGTARPAAYRANLRRLEDTIDRLEAELSAASAAFRAESAPITRAAIQRLIPAGAALIEFAVHEPRKTENGGGLPPRYVAYALPSGEDRPRWADLGDASAVDAAIGAWRDALRNPQRRDVTALARAVDRLLMQPVRRLVGESTHLLVSPDGQLNLIPFAALIDEHNRYLIERYTLTYLTSGRDLLRLRAPVEGRGAPVVVALPDFGDPALLASPGAARKSPSPGAPRVDESQIFFGPLPGVAEEVRALRTLLPDASFLTREQATEAALKGLHGPRILHIATHGFFLGDPPSATVPAASATAGSRLGAWAATTDNPLLRSGLALAGANQRRRGSDDGVLTALEAAGLDLWGTRLVVLSACDTGVGEVKQGDGVYGLRRAFVIAGAETQIMSLWPVSDRSTRDLMSGYYARLTKGSARGEALRETQLQLLRDGRHAHPYHWASFIQSGAWTSLDGTR